MLDPRDLDQGYPKATYMHTTKLGHGEEKERRKRRGRRRWGWAACKAWTEFKNWFRRPDQGAGTGTITKKEKASASGFASSRREESIRPG